MIDPESYWFTQDELAAAALATGATAVVCYIGRRFTVLPEHSRTTCVMGGFFNVRFSGFLYTLPCPQLSDWIWDPNIALVEVDKLAGMAQSPSRRLLERLDAKGKFEKVVIQNWISVIFRDSTKPHNLYAAACTLASALFARYETIRAADAVYGKRSELRRRAMGIVAALQPSPAATGSRAFTEYLDALATQLSRFIWPSEPLDVTANVNLVVFEEDDLIGKQGKPRKDLLRRIVELPRYDPQFPDAIIKLSHPPAGKRRIHLQVASQIGRFSKGAATQNVSDTSFYDFLLGVANGRRGDTVPCLVRHAAQFGDAYALFDYDVNYNVSYGVCSRQTDDLAYRHGYPPALRFFADLHRMLSTESKAGGERVPVSGATNIILPLIDDDEDTCCGAVSIEGVLSAGMIDLTALYLAQYIAHCATEQIITLRQIYFQQQVADISRQVLEGDVCEASLGDNREAARNLLEDLVDNTVAIEFVDTLEKHALGIGRGHSLEKLGDHWVFLGDVANYHASLRAATDSELMSARAARNGYDNADEWWLAVEFRSVEVGRKRERHLLPVFEWICQYGPLQPLTFRRLGTPLVVIADTTDIVVPLFTRYPEEVVKGSTDESGPLSSSRSSVDSYCVGIVRMTGTQSWRRVLEHRDTGVIVSRLLRLISLLQRARVQAMEHRQVNLHELNYEIDLATKAINYARDDAERHRSIGQAFMLARLIEARTKQNHAPLPGVDFARKCSEMIALLRAIERNEAISDTVAIHLDSSMRLAFLACANLRRNALFVPGAGHSMVLREGAEIEPFSSADVFSIESPLVNDSHLRDAHGQLSWFPLGKPGHGCSVSTLHIIAES